MKRPRRHGACGSWAPGSRRQQSASPRALAPRRRTQSLTVLGQSPEVTKSMAKSVVIVPTYNEAGNLPALVERLAAVGPYDLLIVDDDSPDGTGELAERLASEYSNRLEVLHRTQKEGLGRAYVSGFRWALAHEYDLVFQMDADLSHDPSALNELSSALEEADVAVGSRYVHGGGTVDWPWSRKMLSNWGSLYARLMLGVPVKDLTGGFKGFRRPALSALDLDRISAKGFAFQIEVTYRLHHAGFRVAEVPITFAERHAGTSKMSSSIVFEALWLPWRLLLADAVEPLVRGRSLRSLLPSRRQISSRDAR
jgi:dolichol-phosphate mannosyltransferase